MDKDKKSEIHITNNFNAPIGQHIDHVDTINFRMDGDGTFHFGMVDCVEKPKPKQELSSEQLARAIENCQQYFWGNSAYAVVFCICRDDYKMPPNMSAFERKLESLPYKRKRDYVCKTGTITNAFSDNNIYHSHIDKWKEEGADERQIKLRDELRKELAKNFIL